MITYKSENRIGYITLNRPEKRNALNDALVKELKDILSLAEKDDAVKVIVLKANGEVFSAGADLAYLQKLQSNTYQENLADSTQLMELFQRIYQLKKVVIAQVEGHAIAGGCGLATVCDFTFAVPTAKFGYTEVKIGFVPAIVMVFLLRKIGETKAKELLLSGKLIDAAYAQEIGLINEVVAAEEMEAKINLLANRLCDKTSGQSLSLTKQMINAVQGMSFEEGMRFAAAMNARARATDDCKRGIAAFVNKEKITW